MKKKIIIISSSRADYGILNPLIKNLKKSCNLKTIITGSHLSNFYGNTSEEIKKDHIKINYEVCTLNKLNDEIGISRTISKTVEKITLVLLKEKPDLIVILGDRYEIFACAVSAVINKIPIAHLHGGELTTGSLDDIYRHSITKMSHLHFVAHESYRKRVIQMGENPKRVFNVGSLSVENIAKNKLLTKSQLEQQLGLNLKKYNVMITFHPNTIIEKNILFEINQLLISLKNEVDGILLFSFSNADSGSQIIIKKIKNFIKKNDNAYLFHSLGQSTYFSVLKHFDLIIGNSSSGIIEAPSFGINIINIGNRQNGRVMAKKIIHSDITNQKISKAIKLSKTLKYQNIKKTTVNPYKMKNTAKKIEKIILKYSDSNLFKKKFEDI